jgi:hypothetical protein
MGSARGTRPSGVAWVPSPVSSKRYDWSASHGKSTPERRTSRTITLLSRNGTKCTLYRERLGSPAQAAQRMAARLEQRAESKQTADTRNQTADSRQQREVKLTCTSHKGHGRWTGRRRMRKHLLQAERAGPYSVRSPIQLTGGPTRTVELLYWHTAHHWRRARRGGRRIKTLADHKPFDRRVATGFRLGDVHLS